MNTFKINYCLLLLFISINHFLIAQTAITSASATFHAVSGTSDDFSTVGSGTGTFATGTSYTINFRQGASNNLKLTDIVVGGNTFFIDAENSNGTVTIHRKSNTYLPASDTREVICYDLESNSNPTFNVKSQAFSSMKSILESEIINVGIDNIFINDGETVINNVERVDKVFSTNLATTNITKYGFLLLERNGNDQFKIAPITAVNGSNNPTSWGNIYTVSSASWGSTGQTITSLDLKFDNDIVTSTYLGVSSANTPDTQFEPLNTLSSQSIRGVFISYADLGISSNDPIYGFSLFAADVNSAMSNIADLSSDADYPINTGAGSTTYGLDLINGMLMVQSTLVPVKLTHFNAKEIDEGKMLLTWQTIQEQNNEKFVVEKSTDATNWITIGEVQGTKNSTTQQVYTFIDNQIENSLLKYYRLKQIDFDGKFEYSKIATYHSIFPHNELKIYPNPTDKNFKIFFSKPIVNATIKIFSLNGVQMLQINNFSGFEKEIDFSEFSQGMYYIQISTEELFLKGEFLKR
jgi:hypothetical protein